jgi:hypothetical protein
MKKCNKCEENKELNEFSKRTASKDGLRSLCKTCIKIYRKSYYLKNYEKEKFTGSIWQKANPDKVNAKAAAWVKANSGKDSAKSAKRNASKLKATPKGLTKEQKKEITTFYIEAARLTKETGIKHQVDHILPLQGEGITGLHVPWNLQILTASNNHKKKNKFDFTYDNRSWLTGL